MPDTIEYLKMAQGPARPINDDEKALDNHGFTNPNLHRRIDPKDPSEESKEVLPASYKLSVQDVNSYRTTHKYYENGLEDNDFNSDIP